MCSFEMPLDKCMEESERAGEEVSAGNKIWKSVYGSVHQHTDGIARQVKGLATTVSAWISPTHGPVVRTTQKEQNCRYFCDPWLNTHLKGLREPENGEEGREAIKRLY